MRQRNTLILAALLVLLGVYVYFFEIRPGERPKGDRLISFKPEEVASILLTYPKQEIQLQKDAGKWKLTQPLQAAADGSTVGALLAALTAGTIQRTLEKKPGAEDIKSFGLDRPTAKISITLASGITLPSLVFGTTTPLGNSAYVQRGNDPAVYLADASLASGLQKKTDDFRDRQILSFPFDLAAKLVIQAGKESVVLIKGEKGEWQPAPPAKGIVSGAAVAEYLAAISGIAAKAFIDDQPKDLKRYALDPAPVKVAVASKDGNNLAALLIGGKSGDSYYAKREGEPQIYAIDEPSYRSLLRRLPDFLAPDKKELNTAKSP